MVSCPATELTQSVPSAEGLIRLPKLIYVDFNGNWMWSQLKRVQPRLQLKCAHNLTPSKSVLTRRHADMNATGQMKEKALEKHQEDKMNP